MAHLKKPFQLLEINIISAQDLHPVSRRMKTYATAWVHPKRKLSTSVDSQGNNSPTWNDKFVFRVDEEFLRRDTSAVMIEIYAAHWFRDTLVGSVRVLVGNLIPPATRSNHHNHHSPFGMRFAALQVRRPSGRPQGIINIGVGVLDSSMRSMPLYTQLSASAVGYRDLMADDTLLNQSSTATTTDHRNMINPHTAPLLRRALSERSDLVVFDDSSSINGSVFTIPPHKGKGGSLLSSNNGSVLAVPHKGKASPSMPSSSDSDYSGDRNSKKGGKRKKKASSVISGGAEFRDKPLRELAKKGKASSLLGSIISHHKPKEEKEAPDKSPPRESPPKEPKQKNPPKEPEQKNPLTNKPMEENASLVKKPGSLVGFPIKEGSIKSVRKNHGLAFGGPRGSSIVNGKYIYAGPPKGAHSFWSDSEVGPSPSEVAAAVAAQNKYPFDDNGSSVLDGWSVDESVEGLRSKLERWRTELPPLYDRGGYESSGFRSTSQHIRRQSEGGGSGGLFSCFGNVYGYECQCVCGKPPEGRNLSGRFQSPSASAGRSFM